MVKKVVKKAQPKQQAKKAETTGKVSKPKGKVISASTEVEDVDATKIIAEQKKNDIVVAQSTLVESAKVSKALKELKKFISRKQKDQDSSNQLFEDTLIDNVQISFTKKDLFTSKKTFKPKSIKIENRPQSEEKQSIALLVRDNLIDKDLLEKIEGSELNDLLGEIIQGNELKTTYKQYEKRRELFSKYDLFLADDHLVTSLPKLLGKTFYDSKKVPVPIKIGEKFSIKSVTNQIEKTLNSIIYHLPRSNNLVINLGAIDQLNESVIGQVISHFEKEDLKAIFLKSNDSPALALYEKEDAYTEADVAKTEKKTKTVDDDNATALEVEGLPKNIKLSQFERGLIELAQEEEIPQLLASKIKKSNQKAKISAKQEQKKKINEKKEQKKPVAKVDAKNKVTKKTVKKGKK